MTPPILVLQYICRIGTVHRITDRGDVRVQYSNNIRWTFHPGALTKVGFCLEVRLQSQVVIFSVNLDSRLLLLGKHFWSRGTCTSIGGHGECEATAVRSRRMDGQYGSSMIV